jgi:TRAP-type mannitol/chloroaromatic compound transport system permease small subunit
MDRHDSVDRLSLLLGHVLCWLFALGVVLTAWEVVLRYGFNAPTVWVHDSVIALSAICFVFGGAYALSERSHICITSIYDRIAPGPKRWLDALNALFAAIFLGGLTYAAAIQAWRSWGLMETSGRAWDVPIPVLLKSVLFLGAALMTVQALRHAVAALRRRI